MPRRSLRDHSLFAPTGCPLSQYGWRVDSFCNGLDEIPYAKQGDIPTVLRKLDEIGGRFSVFEATATPRIAFAMTAVEKRGLVERVEPEPGYPWIQVRLTERGRALLTGSTHA